MNVNMDKFVSNVSGDERKSGFVSSASREDYEELVKRKNSIMIFIVQVVKSIVLGKISIYILIELGVGFLRQWVTLITG